MDNAVAAFVQPGLQQRKIGVHPADVVLYGLVGLTNASHLRACLLSQRAKEAFHLSTEQLQLQSKTITDLEQNSLLCAFRQ